MMVDVSFEEALTILLGSSAAGSRSGSRRPGGEEAAVFFVLEDGGTGFILAPQHCAGAGWHEDDPSTLVVRLGAVSL